jgi:NTE family protein
MLDHKKIGLALGGGGVKGLAHIGVLKVLERNNIKIDYISGTSIGALVGALYASRGNAAEVEEIVLNSLSGLNWKTIPQVFDPYWKYGILRGDKITRIISGWMKGYDFKNLKIPLTIIATDMKNGREVDIVDGDIVKAIRASISVPFVFAPIKYRNMLLCDGGITNPIPDDAVRRMGADFVVAVNLETGYLGEEIGTRGLTIPRTAIRALNIMRQHLAKYCLESTDLIIEPKVREAGLIGWRKFFDRKQAKQIIKQGERATEKELKQLV